MAAVGGGGALCARASASGVSRGSSSVGGRPTALRASGTLAGQAELRSGRASVGLRAASEEIYFPAPRARQLALFRSLAAYADVQLNLQRFENAAGRAAMVGTAVALGTEALTDEGLFNQLQYGDVAAYVSLVGMLSLAAAGVAGQARKGPGGLSLRRAVTNSLTSLSHSAAAQPVSILDRVLDEVMDAEMLDLISEPLPDTRP